MFLDTGYSTNSRIYRFETTIGRVCRRQRRCFPGGFQGSFRPQLVQGARVTVINERICFENVFFFFFLNIVHISFFDLAETYFVDKTFKQMTIQPCPTPLARRFSLKRSKSE